MNRFDEANLTNAARALAAANTPLFLLRKLREDPVVHEISRSFSGDVILRELQNSLVEREPENLTDVAKPYAYLTALALNPDVSYLSAATRLKVPGHWQWFPYLGAVLLQTFAPTVTQVAAFPAQIQRQPEDCSNAPVTHGTIILASH